MSLRPTKLFALLIAAVALVAGLSAATAQDTATPAADEGPATLGFVTAGDCEAPATILFKLNDLTAGGDATPVADMAASASPVAGEAWTSTTDVNAALDDLIAEPHAINFRESLQAIDTFTACGEIAGEPTDGELEIEIAEQNGSGLSGTATLTDNGDGTTTIVVTLVQGEPSPVGTPEATPVS
jgi:hypothetical protein